ncbi:MAG: hypothetical protein JXB46_06285 [Candidatus Eisenbacteria bacterium]|nr:hypothetical protein [Candidatus Eisenbacteria bacterium]
MRDLVDWRSEEHAEIALIADLTCFGVQSPPNWRSMIGLLRYITSHGARDRIHFVSPRTELARRVFTLLGFPATRFTYHHTMEEALAATLDQLQDREK